MSRWSSFDIHDEESDETIAKRLDDLLKTYGSDETKLSLYAFNFARANVVSASLQASVLRLFQHFLDKGCRWDRLRWHGRSMGPPHWLLSAPSLTLFRDCEIVGWGLDTANKLTIEGDECLQGLTTLLARNSLHRLGFSNTNLSEGALRVISDALKSTECSLEELRLGRSYLPNREETSMATGDHWLSKFCQALSNNKSLLKLELDNVALYDEDGAKIVKALENHPSLLDFSVANQSLAKHYSLNRCNRETLAALSVFLKNDSCRLHRLDLSHQFIHRDKLAVDLLVNGIEGNSSLRILDLSSNELTNKDAKSLLTVVMNGSSSLSEIDLVNNMIDSITFGSADDVCCQSRLEKFLLCNNPMTAMTPTQCTISKEVQSTTKTALLNLVRFHPRMVDLGPTWSTKNIRTPAITHQMDMNRAGRVQLHPNVSRKYPIGTWSIFLERTTTSSELEEDPERWLSVLFCLVRGLVQGPLATASLSTAMKPAEETDRAFKRQRVT